MLNATPQQWSLFVNREPSLPLTTLAGESTSFEALLRHAGGRFVKEIGDEIFAARHAQAQRALDVLERKIHEARPDVIVLIGDDQKELFLSDNMPSMAIFSGEALPYAMRAPRAGLPEWFRPVASLYYPTQASDWPVAADLARHLIGCALRANFDVATSDRTPRGEGIGHAYAFVRTRLLRKRIVPVVPVFLNTYYPPNQPTPERCLNFGRALAQAIRSWPGTERVAIVASGGLSHFTVDEELDRSVLAALQSRDATVLRELPLARLDHGSSEIRNWICAAGALEQLHVDWTEYIPAYRTLAGTGVGLAFTSWSE